MANTFVALAGNIGTGKTTITKLLSQHYGWDAYFESVNDNPYLEDFYKDMERWALALQTYFLTHRFRSHRKIMTSENSAIQDRTIYEDAEIFSKNLFKMGKMAERDYKTYLDLYHLMIPFLQSPHLIVYLRKSTPALLKSIARRGRDFEKSISPDYLSQLNQSYDEWIRTHAGSRCITIESDDMDFIHSDEDFTFLRRVIINNLEQPDLFIREEEITPASVHDRIRIANSSLDS